tara:strand:+ start:65 stop:310 length:246 start_codon:yes stop_codon:yes gene_type:complete
MNVTKETLLQLIKEEISMVDGEMSYQPSEQELIDLAREEISTIDAYRGIQRGDFDYHHVAAALHKLADEYQEAADRQGQEV